MRGRMTNRERMTRFIKGQPTDRVPFVQYDHIGGPNQDIWNVVGRQNMGISVWTLPYQVKTPGCSVSSEPIVHNGYTGFRDTFHTPMGDLFQERVSVPALPKVMSIKKHYVHNPEDYRIVMAYLQAMCFETDRSAVQRVWDYVGDDGIPHVWIGRTPYQELWVDWVSMEDLSFHLVDIPDLLDEIMHMMGENLLKKAVLVAELSDTIEIPYVVIGDNITAPLIGPDRFARYCVPYYQQVAEILHAKKLELLVHMDGDLQSLRQLIAISKLGGIDSFSPQPDNDMTVTEALRYWPGIKLLMNFPSSVHLLSEQEIYAKTREILAEADGTGALQIQISENPPPGRWAVSYPQIIRAIEDHARGQRL